MKNEANPTVKSNRSVPTRLIVMSVIGVIVVGLSGGFFAICSAIGSGVRTVSAEALQEQTGDNVLALIAYVESEKHTLKERNRAVWALGQLGDPRALTVLKKYYTGPPCDHEHALCQKELSKAINLCKGGTNITAIFWRNKK
jgi:hypothetical protein